MAPETELVGRARIFAALLCLTMIAPAYALRGQQPGQQQAGQQPGGQEPARPIIAQLVDDPAGYDGRTILIYGLVVDTQADAGGFFLQDVSQRPLLVEGGVLPVAVGDELEVVGTFERHGGEFVLRAARITPTKVLGGGGCC